jgi:hypothetical protein
MGCNSPQAPYVDTYQLVLIFLSLQKYTKFLSSTSRQCQKSQKSPKSTTHFPQNIIPMQPPQVILRLFNEKTRENIAFGNVSTNQYIDIEQFIHSCLFLGAKKLGNCAD